MSISVHLPDGSSRELDAGATAADLAADIGPGLAKAALIATINGDQVDLNVELTDGDTVSLITETTDEGLETIRHSTSHVLAQAVLELWPGSTFAIGPPIEHVDPTEDLRVRPRLVDGHAVEDEVERG